MQNKVKYVLFDAANTLIHKPELWIRINQVLIGHGYSVNRDSLLYKHKIVSELTDFPDRTTKNFYREFNTQLLFALGIIPTEKLLNDLFEACTYLPWEKFDDTGALSNLQIPFGVLSNFNSSLTELLESLFTVRFNKIIISENHKFRKPSLDFYKLAINELNLNPGEILYIGDSIKLDIEPAQKTGMQAYLIDRANVYPHFQNRLQSLKELHNLLNE